MRSIYITLIYEEYENIYITIIYEEYLIYRILIYEYIYRTLIYEECIYIKN